MKLSPTLSIDSIDYASQGNAILGIRNSGKSYTATYIAERLMDDGIPFIAFDPIGIWRYLKVGKKGAGYPVVVAGENGDLPLTPESAPDIVRAAMKENVSLVVDLYSMHLSKKDWRTIVEQCIRLLVYENKPCGLRHIFIEESAEFVPQVVQSEQGRVYAEIEKLARMGGNASLGYTLINQRAEQINKAVLELCDCLFLHRQKGRHSLTALGKWLEVADTKNAKAIINSLPSLEQGECWVWSEGSHDPQRIVIPEKKTVHPDRKNPLLSSAGITSDVSRFVDNMTTWLVAMTAKSLPAAPKKGAAVPDHSVEIDKLRTALQDRDGTIKLLKEQISQQNAILQKINLLILDGWPPSADNGVPAKHITLPVAKPEGAARTGNGSLTKCARSILTFLASYDREFSRVQVGISAGYSPKTSTFSNALGELAGRGLILRDKGLRANRAEMDAIVEAVGPVKKQKYNIATFKEKLVKCEREIYEVLLRHPEKSYSKQDLAAVTPSKYSAGTSTFSNALGRLNSLGLIERHKGGISLHPDLAKML